MTWSEGVTDATVSIFAAFKSVMLWRTYGGRIFKVGRKSSVVVVVERPESWGREAACQPPIYAMTCGLLGSPELYGQNLGLENI